MRVRKLDASGDMQFGQGQASFWKDVPDAPAQCVLTRLVLELGEFFLDTTEGTAWKAKVLGKRTASTRDPVIRARTLGTQGITGIAAYSSALDRDTRAFTVSVTLDTLYGQTTVEVPA